MIETLKVIALLCVTSPSASNYAQAKIDQLDCQKYYVTCMEKHNSLHDAKLEKCVLDRRISKDGKK